MHLKRWTVLWLVWVLFAFTLPLFAQDDELEQAVALPEGFTISIPADWAAEENEAIGGFVFEGDEARVLVVTPDRLADLVDIDADEALTDILVGLFQDFEGSRARESDIEALELGEYTAASYRFTTDDDDEGLFIVVDFGAGDYGLIDYITPNGALDNQLQLVKLIAETFVPGTPDEVESDTGESGTSGGGNSFTAPTGRVSGSTGSNATTNASAASTGECIVSTEDANTVQLHVGPGYNRAVITFLPAGTDFEVTGSFTANDGSEWFQLVKNEAAPASAAAEVWVARENVNEAGDCDAVGDASAPPIVPIISSPPVVQNTSEPGAPAATAVPNVGGQSPSNGTWTLTFAPTMPISCLNTETVHIDTSEIWDTTPFVARITVASDGNSFMYGGDSYTRISPTSFSGSFNFDDGSNAQMRLDVISATQMAGQVVLNETVDGTPCSGTTSVSVNRN